MKKTAKITLLALLVALVAAMVPVNIFAADEYVITFNSVDEYPDILHVDSMDIAIEEDALKFTLTGGTHPLFWFGVGAEGTKNETPINASEYKYMKIRYKSEAEDDVLRFFYATYTDLNANPGPAFTGENMVDMDIKHGAGWQSLIYDLGAVTNWKDYISALRFDLDPLTDGAGLTGDSAGDSFFVGYIAFFKTEAEAKAYKSELDPVETEPAETSGKQDDSTSGTKETPAVSTEAPSTSGTPAVSSSGSGNSSDGNGNTVLWVVIAAAALIVIVIVAIVEVKKKKAK